MKPMKSSLANRVWRRLFPAPALRIISLESALESALSESEDQVSRQLEMLSVQQGSILGVDEAKAELDRVMKGRGVK